MTPPSDPSAALFDDVEALIFDVDGTLAETEEAHRLAFNDAFAEAGLEWDWTPDVYRDLLRVTGGKERIAHFLTGPSKTGTPPSILSCPSKRRRWPTEGANGDAAPNIPALHGRKTALYAARVSAGAVPLRPGVEALIALARRRGVRLAIATTTSRPNIDALLAATLGAEAAGWFEAIACGDDVAAKKPAPDVYQLALATLGLPPDRAMAIEDSWNGVRAAKGAGLRVIATPSLYSADDDFSDADMICEPARIAARLGWV